MSKKVKAKPGKAVVPAKKPAAAAKSPPHKTAKARAAAKPMAKAAPVKKILAPKPPAKGSPKVVAKSLVQAGKAQASQKAGSAPTSTGQKPAAKIEVPKKKMAHRAKLQNIVLPPDYRPSEDEPFMNEMHRAYFRKRLIEWKDDILRQTRETLAILHEDSSQHADLADRATSETDRATELRTRDRQRKLISKIDAALSRIDDGTYGYCEDTGEPIGLKRLDARPIATLSVEAQERHERRERVYREE